MKVKCIDNNGYETRLTISKTYKVIKEDNCNYAIINDTGYASLFLKKYFKTLSEIRNKKIDKLLR